MGLAAEKLEAGRRRDAALSSTSGYEAEICFPDNGQTAEQIVKTQLAVADYGCILTDAGVRTDTQAFLLFAELINVVHEHAPKSKDLFRYRPYRLS